MKSKNEPHVTREKKLSTLRNGNKIGNPNSAPRCSAINRAKKPCKAPAMKNGKCRFHGGKSTGPKTKEGLKRSIKANLKHGYYSKKMKIERSQMRDFFKKCEDLINEMTS